MFDAFSFLVLEIDASDIFLVLIDYSVTLIRSLFFVLGNEMRFLFPNMTEWEESVRENRYIFL